MHSLSFAGHDITCVRSDRTVFHGLNFAVAQGEALLLKGPNGTGKSSLLRLCAGLLKPAKGQLTWGGEDIAEDPSAHGARLHYIGHLDPIKPVFTVEENLTAWAGMKNVEPQLEAALDRLGLRHLRDVPGRMLSAGQRRRLNLARLIAMPAPLWLLDEPTNALDRESVKTLVQVVEEHKQSGGIVLLATHDDALMQGTAVLEVDKAATVGEPHHHLYHDEDLEEVW